MTSAESLRTYEVLSGLALGDGWTLGTIRPSAPGSSGGNFSVQFDVHNADGRAAFCKVLDLVEAARPPEVAKKLEFAAKAFNYEAELVRICNAYASRRVVFALRSDEIEDSRVPLGLVKFIIFERADEDVRTYLDKGIADELHLRFRALRHAALGLRELHDLNIAHQDLKPSNVVVFGCASGDPHESKVADLGRASLYGEVAVHDGTHVAGAYAYSPPELLYGQVATDFYERRQSCDLYQMGCLIAFVIGGVSINREWNSRLARNQQWRQWGGTYADIYPVVRAALNDTFSVLEAELPTDMSADVMKLVRDLCDPDPSRRGAGLRGGSQSRRIVLSRLVTRLNVLEDRARTLGLRVA